VEERDEHARWPGKTDREQPDEITGREIFTPLAIKGVFVDPLAVNSFLELIDFMRRKVAPRWRQIAFERMIAREKCDRQGDVFYMNGARYNETESQTAQKLAKAGYWVIFPGKGQIKAIKDLEKATDNRENDIYLFHKKSYKQYKVDIKSSGEPSIKSIGHHIASGSGQAPVIALDITGNISKKKLITAIRTGWTNGTKTILLNYKGKWYELDKKKVFGDWIEIHIQ
jgi:hypothetical protein